MKSLEQIIISNDAIKNEFKDCKLNASLAFRVARFIERTDNIIKPFLVEKDKLIIEKYGEKVGEGFKVKDECLNDFITEYKNLLAQEEDFDFTFDLELFKGVEVSAQFFTSMGDFIKE